MESELVKAVIVESNNAGEVCDGNEAKPKMKKTRGEADAEVSGMRIGLPASIAAKMRAATQELKMRGATVTAEDLLADYWERLPDSYVEEQLTKMTPEDYYLEAARKIPELRDKLIQQAKKALALSLGGRPTTKRGRRPRVVAESVDQALTT